MMNLLKKVKTYTVTFFAGIISAVVAVLFFVFKRKSTLPFNDAAFDERQADRKQSTEAEKTKIETEKSKAENRKQKAKDADAIRETIVKGSLSILLCCLLLPSAAHATGPAPFIPADYDALKQYYLTVWDLSEQYRELYMSAEASIEVLHISNLNLMSLIDEQKEEIEFLREEIKRLKEMVGKLE